MCVYSLSFASFTLNAQLAELYKEFYARKDLLKTRTGAQKNSKSISGVIDLVDSPQSELPTPTNHHVYPSVKGSSEAPCVTAVQSVIAAPPDQPSIPVSSLASQSVTMVAASAKQTRVPGMNLLLMLDRVDKGVWN